MIKKSIGTTGEIKREGWSKVCLSFLRTSVARLMVFAEFCIRQFLAYFNETACVEDGAGVTYPCNREPSLRMEPVRLPVDEDTRGFLVMDHPANFL